MKIGYGWDSHEFKRGIPLKIGGVEIAHEKGLGGHSDGALLGAIAAPDIGTLFSPSDPRWEGADSAVFLGEALRRVAAAGYKVLNIDSTLILSTPKIGPHANALRDRVSQLTAVPPDCIGIKAKTPEGMGTENAAIAHAVVLLQKISTTAGRKPTKKPRS